MNLSWKDLIGTVGTAITTYIYYTQAKGINLPVISSTRIAFIAIGVIGLATCAMSGKMENGFNSPLIIFLSILGGIALLLVIIGAITGNKSILAPLAGLIIILWIITTIRHLVTK